MMRKFFRWSQILINISTLHMIHNGAIALLRSTRHLGLYSPLISRASYAFLLAPASNTKLDVRSHSRQVERKVRTTNRVAAGHGRGRVSSHPSDKRKGGRDLADRQPRKEVRAKAKRGATRPVERGGVKVLLQPHALSGRLRKMCDEGQLDQAVSTLKNAPLDAQNTPVWNTLIWECMKASRFKLGYQLFTDVSDDISSASCLLTGLFR
jgi:hypothetical protein